MSLFRKHGSSEDPGVSEDKPHNASVKKKKVLKADSSIVETPKPRKKKEPKGLNKRVEEWEAREWVIDLTINTIVAIIVLCMLASLAFMTLTFDEHYFSIIMIPIVVFYWLSSPGLKLRKRELHSMLMLADLISIILILILCLYVDNCYSNNVDKLYEKILICLFGIVGLSLFCSRHRLMWYVGVPFGVLFPTYFSMVYGLEWHVSLFVGLTMFMVYISSVWGHGFYFGIGRVYVDGRFQHVPESEAKVIRRKQKDVARARRRESKAVTREARKNGTYQKIIVRNGKKIMVTRVKKGESPESANVPGKFITADRKMTYNPHARDKKTPEDMEGEVVIRDGKRVRITRVRKARGDVPSIVSSSPSLELVSERVEVRDGKRVRIVTVRNNGVRTTGENAPGEIVSDRIEFRDGKRVRVCVVRKANRDEPEEEKA